jgi:hypothetical protein
MSSGELCIRPKCLPANCPFDQNVYRQSVGSTKMSIGEVSVRPKCLPANCWFGQIVFWRTVHSTKMPIGHLSVRQKCLSANCPFDQNVYRWSVGSTKMSIGEVSVRPGVALSTGKDLRASILIFIRENWLKRDNKWITNLARLPDGTFSYQNSQIWANFGGSWIWIKCYILRPFGIFYGHLVYFMVFWYILRSLGIFSRFGMFYQTKSGKPGYVHAGNQQEVSRQGVWN